MWWHDLGVLGSIFHGYFWHPLRNGPGYNFWSGPLADLGLITIFTGLAFFVSAWWRKHNCHVHKCWRLQWHEHPGHGHPVCAKHHPYGQGRGGHLEAEHHTEGVHATWPKVIARQGSTSNTMVAATSTGLGEVEVVVGVTDLSEKRGDS